jgi:hypothetical protein
LKVLRLRSGDTVLHSLNEKMESGTTAFGSIRSLAVDARGCIFVSHSDGHSIRRVNPFGVTAQKYMRSVPALGSFPVNVLVFITSYLPFDSDGMVNEVVTEAGTSEGDYEDGNASEARFKDPAGLLLISASQSLVVKSNVINYGDVVNVSCN